MERIARRVARLSTLLGVSLLLVGGCKDPASPEQQALDAAVAKWNQARPASNSYVMEQQVACFCPYGGTTYDVVVAGGVITSATAIGGPASGQPPLSTFRTVDQLFAVARDALKNGTTLTDLSFDSTLGFPTTVSVDPVPMAVDDEVSYRTRKVTLR